MTTLSDADGTTEISKPVHPIYMVQSTLLFEDHFEGSMGITRAKFLADFTGDFLSEYAKMFRRLGYRVTFIYFSKRSSQIEREIHRPTGAEVLFFPISPMYRQLLPFKRIFRTPVGRYVEEALSTINSVLVDYIKQNPGIVYVQDYETGRFDVLADVCSKLGVPFIGTHHGSTIPRFLYGIKRNTLPKAALITVLNSDTEKRMRQNFGSITIRRIVNPIDTEAFGQDVSAGYHCPSAGGRLLYAGRLHKRKNIPHLIETLSHLPEDYSLVLAGSGPEEARLREQTERLGLTSRVTFLGFVGRQKLLELYREADIFVLAAHWEGWALVLGEAGCCGVPIVALDVEGVRDQVENGVNGELVTDRSPTCFAKAVEQVMDGIRSGRCYQRESIAAYVASTCAKEAIQKLWHNAFVEVGLERDVNQQPI
jgi:glycosyltransferase involved in cell wall biosynthesis